MKILETERLLLRGLEQGDFKDVCKLLQDDEVMYAYEGAFNDQEVQNWLDRQFGRYRHDGFGLWGVVEKGSIIRKTKNSSFKNEKSKKEVDVTITVSNKDIV